MIGLLVIIIGVIALIKYQKEPQVETANFGFHIHKVRSPSWFSKLLIKIKGYFRFRRKQTLHINLEEEIPSRSRHSSYGSLSESMSGSFYNNMPPSNVAAKKMYYAGNRMV
jgi:hypothetical protein